MHEYHQMFSNMSCFVLQKAVFYNTKGHLLPCKRWPFGNALIYSGLIIDIPYHNISIT